MKNNKHLYKQIELDILNKIEDGFYKPGDKIGTEKELSDKFQVSRSTIRRAFKSLENSNLIERLLGKGTFVKEISKKERKISTNKNIMVIVPVISQNFISEIITGIQEKTSKEGYNINLCITNNSIEKESFYIKKAQSSDVSGIILHPTNSKYYNPDVINMIPKKPLIMTARYYKYIDCNYVVPDNFKGAFNAVNYLIKMGHKNIGLVSDKPNFKTSLQDRISGYREAFFSNKLPINRDLIMDNLDDPCRLYSSRPKNKYEIFDKIKKYLNKNKNDLSAVFTINDFIGREIILAAKELNLKVPEDLSIVSFDNVMISKKSEPPLTTINWSQFNVGSTAAEHLIDLIENKNNKKVKKVLATKLIKRNSVFSLKKIISSKAVSQ